MGCAESIKRTASVLFFVQTLSCTLPAQELSATRFEVTGPAWDGVSGALIGTREVIPLVIANTAPTAQPIRFLTGPLGSVRAMEISSAADVWVRGPLSVGALTGAAANEGVRIATIPATLGRGLTVDLTGTTTSTGILIQNVGSTGSDDAGIVMKSIANGVGTAIRIGGPQSSLRPTFSAGIDITGGTGVRYNALNAGSGTALDIGGTVAPMRGVDATASGTGHIAVLARANSNGTGVIGMSQSASYTSVPSIERIGVYGRAASNSTVGADTLVGVFGNVIRGGNGGTLTTSVAVRAHASTSGTLHAGTSIALLASAEAIAPGVAVPVGGVFTTATTGLSLVTLGGHVLLGCAANYKPPAFTASTITGETQTTTQIYDVQISGVPSFVHHNTQVLAPGVTVQLAVANAPVVRVISDAAGSELGGIGDAREGRLLVLINTDNVLTLTAENIAAAANMRIITPDMAALVVPEHGAVTLWYDAEDQRWRVIGINF